jgi:zinc-binding alcohol dehydrogenase/oxidoreductase
MRAALLEALHSPLIIKDVAEPQSAEGEVLVDMCFAALNHRDLWIQKGQYARISLPLIPCSDGSGMYNGSPVLINPSLNWGEDERAQGKDYRILGMPDQGTLAEKLSIKASQLHPVPSYLSLAEASALPLAGLTAYRALMVKCKPVSGENVLISGVGGGVATLAFQMAVAAGCRVFVTSGSAWKREKALEMGASGAFDYKDPDLLKKMQNQTDGFDIVIDSAGGSGFNTLLRACRPGARVSIYGGTEGDIPAVNPQLLFWKQLTIMGSTMGSDQDFTDMLKFVNQYSIRPVIDRIFSMTRVNEAWDYMNRGEQFGKVVIDICQ